MKYFVCINHHKTSVTSNPENSHSISQAYPLHLATDSTGENIFRDNSFANRETI